ncbi:MAG: type II toxin-antitoxin system Phd/YefM family antitoxin [Acidimicrobiales bacterium]
MIVNMHQAKSQLSRLVELVQTGETVIIANNSKPVAQLVSYWGARARRYGAWADRIRVHDLDETPEWLVELFYDEEP